MMVADRITLHVTKCHDLLSHTSAGLKGMGRSTELLPAHLTEQWGVALDSGKVIFVIFIDFPKPFDTVSHDLLPKRFQGYVTT